MAAPKQTDPQFKLRMTPEIKEMIEKAALESNRSMNAEILSRLELSFRPSVSKAIEKEARLERQLNELREEFRHLRETQARATALLEKESREMGIFRSLFSKKSRS